MDGSIHPYSSLTPDVVLDALASVGVDGDGRLLALGSYENRVYQVYRDEAPAVVAKFYRPERWTDEQIIEEHAFALELAAREIPIVAPLVFDDEQSLHAHAGFRFAVYPRRGGRARSCPIVRRWNGSAVSSAAFTRIGAIDTFAHRRARHRELRRRAARVPASSDWLPTDLRDVLDRRVGAGARRRAPRVRSRRRRCATIRLHGDCHAGNVLWTDDGPHFVDLDDCRTGPAVQDLWMLMPGDRDEASRALAALLDGYERFADSTAASCCSSSRCARCG